MDIMGLRKPYQWLTFSANIQKISELSGNVPFFTTFPLSSEFFCDVVYTGQVNLYAYWVMCHWPRLAEP